MVDPFSRLVVRHLADCHDIISKVFPIKLFTEEILAISSLGRVLTKEKHVIDTNAGKQLSYASTDVSLILVLKK